MQKICFNGVFMDEAQPVLNAANKSYRYGDGFFETMRIANYKILLSSYHQSRIEKSISLLQYRLPEGVTVEALFEKILELCQINNCETSARVRLSFSNGNGSLLKDSLFLYYLVEAWPLNEARYAFNDNGLTTGIFTDIKKSCDVYANIKSSSAMLYSVASRFGKANQWDDVIILNQRENICESTIANIFWIKDEKIFTTALTEGCVNGVMRAYLIDKLEIVTETPCRIEDLLRANEVFLTNIIKGIRWIERIGGSVFKNTITKKIYEQHLAVL